jgi:ubiquinone biosynthesis protein UbiJ
MNENSQLEQLLGAIDALRGDIARLEARVAQLETSHTM